MSALFSWPTVTVGMSPPCVNGDPPAPSRGAAAGRFRLLIATGITVALRGPRRTRKTPGRVPWSAASRPGTRAPRPSPVDQGHESGAVLVRVAPALTVVNEYLAAKSAHSPDR